MYDSIAPTISSTIYPISTAALDAFTAKELTDYVEVHLARLAEFPAGACGKRCPLFDITLIPLTRGLYAVVDIVDYDLVSKFKWHANKKNNGYYAGAYNNGEYNHMHGKYIYMHRLILSPDQILSRGMVGHHKDGNTLNERRCNLELVTDAENKRYQRKRKQNENKTD